MKKVIMQNCGVATSIEFYYDWKVGQESVKELTGFEYSYYNPLTQEIKAFYNVPHNETELSRGQKSLYA